jgi:phage I-like protein
MNAPILNREFKHPADGWYMIESKGEHPNATAGIVQVIDGESSTAIVSRFNADATAGALRHGHEMLVDHEHFSDQPDQETRAYGWLTQLQNRADGIYGQVRWTATGKPAVDGGDYRFFSTEYLPKDLKVVNDGKVKRVRPLRLEGLTLTNMHNNRGQKPITNRDNLAGAVAPASNQNHNQNKKPMKTIATKLGLAAEASEEAILEALTKIQNRLTTLEPLEAENLKLTNRVKKLDEDGISALLAERKIMDEKIINRLKPVLAGMLNREERIQALDDFGFTAEAGADQRETGTQQTTQTKLRNRDTKPPAAGSAEAQKNEQAEKALATKIMNRATELQKNTPNLSAATAVIMAQNELENAA